MYTISVIIPVYNAEKYLKKAIDSVLSQTLARIELVCINDGSKDGSMRILSEYQKNYSNIKVIDQKNSGAACARNTGIQRAEGEYVFFLDSDDWIPNCHVLEHLYSYAKNHNLQICGGSLCRWDGNTYHHNFNQTQGGYVFQQEGVVSYETYQFDLGFSRFIYDRSMILQKNIIFPMYRNYEDPFFFVKAMTEAKQFGAIVEDVYVYRETQGSASHQKSLESILDMLQGMWDNLKLAEKNHYCRLYTLTFQRMNKESLCEIEYALNNLDTEKKLFLLLLQINASIKWDLIPDYTKCLLEPLDMIYQEYRKYEKIRNGKMVRGIRRIRSFLKR